MARIINIIERGLSDPARITSDDTLSNLQSLEKTSTDLSNSNNEIRRSISKIDQSEQPRFYKEILIYERGDNTQTKQLNSLDACTEIVNSGLRLNDMIPSKPAFDDPDLVFILSNTLNDLVVSNEEIANILLDDNRISLQKVETTIIILLIATVAISFGIITFVGRSEKKFAKRKINFLDSFLRIKDYEIASTLAVVNNFNNALKENDREEKFLQKVVIDKIRVEEFKKNDGKKEHRSFKAKSANLKGMNTSIFVNLGLVTAFVIFFILIFGILLAVLLNFQSSISKLMLRVINTNINLFQFGLVFTSLFEYVSENGATTIRDEPIGDEWERTYRVLTGSNDFFNSFMDQDENFNNQMAFLLNSDLCSSYFTDRPCATELSGVGTRGILGINAFILKNLRGIKDYYDDTDRSPAAKEVTLGMQDMLDAEIAYTIYTSRSYTELDLILTNQFYLESDKLLKSSLIIGIVSIVVLLVLTKVVWLQAIKRMEDERKNFRNIMRVIPINIIMSNRYLKNYLMRNSQKMLDSIKNRI